MENVIEWNVGLNDFKKCTLELGEDFHQFTTELLDVTFDPTIFPSSFNKSDANR